MSPEDNQAFRSELTEIVFPNMPLLKAKERLAKAGFACDERSYAPEISCTRVRNNISLSSCVQRVNLTTDTEQQTVLAVKPKEIVCTGM